VDQYKCRQRRLLRMRPGLTCQWAVSGRDNVDFETWMTMDMQYIDNWSLALDWKILVGIIPPRSHWPRRELESKLKARKYPQTFVGILTMRISAWSLIAPI
jgi:hypothetical protein